MDTYTESLLERTSQRRAMINQKLGKTSDPAARKRALEDTTNIPIQADAVDDSPKRQCTMQVEEMQKPDTPAIPSVKSRLNVMSNERIQFDSRGNVATEVSHPMPEPRKSPASSSASRKARFAHLAENIENFEFDLSHPTIRKQEEKKPKWQPPMANDVRDRSPHHDARDRHVSSVRKELEPHQGPQKDSKDSGVAPSAKINETPLLPVAPSVQPEDMDSAKSPMVASPLRPESSNTDVLSASSSPQKSLLATHTRQAQTVSSPKFTHQVKPEVTNQEPVNKRQEDSSSVHDPANKPVVEKSTQWKKTVDTPCKDKSGVDPTQLPLSERFAGWEQRVAQTPKADKVISSKVPPTPKQFCTPAKVGVAKTNENSIETGKTDEKPVSEVRASWKQQDAKNNPPQSSEPTAYSVTDRMSAWEAATSSNQVGSMKKVAPGTPGNTPLVKAGNFKPTPSKLVTLHPNGTSVRSLTHQKSFKENIEERAAQIGSKSSVGTSALLQRPTPVNNARSPLKSTGSPKTGSQSPLQKNQSSPNKSASPPAKVASAAKRLQQKILEQGQHGKIDPVADKIRQQRMAEVNTLMNRYQNGVLKANNLQQLHVAEQACTDGLPMPPPIAPTSQSPTKTEKQDLMKAIAREDFSRNLQSTAKKPTSIFGLVSKKCGETEKPNVTLQCALTEKPVAKLCPSSLKKDQLKDQNGSTGGGDASSGVLEETVSERMEETNDENRPSVEDLVSKTPEFFDDAYENEPELSMPESFTNVSESSIPDPFKSPLKQTNFQKPACKMTEDDDDGDDVSLSAFVPASVRRQSVLPERSQQDDSSEDSFEYNVNNQPASNRKERYTSDGGLESNNIDTVQQRNDNRDSDDEIVKSEMDQLLDEAMDSISEVVMRKKNAVPVPQKRQSHVSATTKGEFNVPSTSDSMQVRAKSDGLAYSISTYRSNRTSQEIPTASQRIARNSHYVQEHVIEEDIQMPAFIQPDIMRKTVHERIKELQELVSQEQSVIMQTSNALNKCCHGDSQFAGSAEQVECNRLLLVSCQKRMAYLTEIQRLKETGELEPKSMHGPKGSLTISDIRLPLKKDFVTKIGTSSDCTVYYFVILIRNGAQVITTQMLSTHDPTMRGSLDFPNLIKLHGISANYNIKLEIYSMMVSREVKDNKKKTPKKSKHSQLTLESPGGPSAVRTTGFMLITTMPITLKSLDKSSYTLEKIPFLSPLHGMIYMRLKCVMEQNIEERGFLTMFEDVSGLGAWHRRWCMLTGNKLCYWKYPDDETKKDPMGLIDLKRVITEKVGLIPCDLCARPNTFELVSVRPPGRGEQDTLISKTYSTMTTTKFMLSADTKEERIVWCNKINRALVNIRTWHADALRPVSFTK